MQDFLSMSKPVKPVKPRFTLRKLPMLGGRGASEVNFEWPTQETLDRMPEDVSLKSIMFAGYLDGQIAYT